MARLCRILIAATLVVHLMVGCCSHHAHASDDRDCPRPPHRDRAPDGPCLGHAPDHAHHGPQDCQGEKCSFVSPHRVMSESLVQPFQAFFVALSDDHLPLAGFGPGRPSLASGRLLLPVRLHPANQVLLL
jgi:hypothetical protein